MSQTATPLEILYTLAMIVGLLTTAANVLYARRRLIELRISGENGLVLIMRKGALADQWRLFGAFAAMTCIGMVALAVPRNPAAGMGAMISGGAFLLIAGLLLWLSISVRLRPMELRREAKRD